MKDCKPFIFHRIHRLCRSDGAILRSKAQKNHFRSLAMQDESFHPAFSFQDCPGLFQQSEMKGFQPHISDCFYDGLFANA